MCTSKPKAPKPIPPAPPPPPPAPVTQVDPAVARPKSPTDLRRGKSKLRIDRTVNSTGSTGSGLNIPG